MSVSDAGAIAAAYGSVSAVTFVAATGFLESQKIAFGGEMVAVMALMESPAIIVGVILMMRYDKESEGKGQLKDIVQHSFTNGSVLMILGSLVIGIIADTKQAEGIKPFTTDIFKGFLAIFLLEMGMVTAKTIRDVQKIRFVCHGFRDRNAFDKRCDRGGVERFDNGKRRQSVYLRDFGGERVVYRGSGGDASCRAESRSGALYSDGDRGDVSVQYHDRNASVLRDS